MLTATGNLTVFSGDFSVNQSLAVCDEIDWSKGKDQNKGCTNPCGGGDGFKEILGELDLLEEYSYGNGDFSNCKLKCRGDCLCYAYSYINKGGWDCKIRKSRRGKYVSSNSQRIFIRDSFVLMGGTPKTDLS